MGRLQLRSLVPVPGTSLNLTIRSRKIRPSGFTLLEVLTVVIVIAVLATLTIGLMDQLRTRSERVNCTANLRSLYAGLNTAVLDRNGWPQNPHKLGNDAYDGWWVDELAKYGIAEKQWHCPTYSRLEYDPAVVAAQGRPDDKDKKKHRLIHYLPTQFDDNPTTPRRWPTQPWLIEIGAMHGDGPLIIFPDGSVRSLGEFQRQGAR